MNITDAVIILLVSFPCFKHQVFSKSSLADKDLFLSSYVLDKYARDTCTVSTVNISKYLISDTNSLILSQSKLLYSSEICLRCRLVRITDVFCFDVLNEALDSAFFIVAEKQCLEPDSMNVSEQLIDLRVRIISVVHKGVVYIENDTSESLFIKLFIVYTKNAFGIFIGIKLI